MDILFRYDTGKNVDGIVLAVGRDRMRVVVNNCDDTMELRLRNKQWRTEDGEAVEVEALLTDGRTNPSFAGHHQKRVA